MRQTEYVCTACGLMLEIGWTHGVPSGHDEPLKWYTTRTRLICNECGAQYKIEMAGPFRISAYMQPLKDHGLPLPDRLLGTNRRIFLKGLPKKTPENYDHSDYEVAHAIIDQHRGHNLDEWYEINPIETKYNQILLSKQPCQSCLTVGKIGGDIRTGDACPHCKEQTLLSVFKIVT